MKKIKVSEASEAVLDWLVENADLRGRLENTEQRASITNRNIRLRHEWSPSVNWAQGGSIIEREGIDLYCNVPSSIASKHNGWLTSWRAAYRRCGFGTDMSYGPTPLIAAMRCYVASKLGDLVEVPEELIG